MNLRNLTPASGCQDHTTSLYASAPFVRANYAPTLPRPPHPPPNVRDDREALLLWARDGGSSRFDLPDGESEIFLCKGLDIATSGTKAICPSGSLSIARMPIIPAAFSAIRARRPKFLVRRRGGDLLNPANIHQGEREIIARD